MNLLHKMKLCKMTKLLPILFFVVHVLARKLDSPLLIGRSKIMSSERFNVDSLLLPVDGPQDCHSMSTALKTCLNLVTGLGRIGHGAGNVLLLTVICLLMSSKSLLTTIVTRFGRYLLTQFWDWPR